MKEIQLVLTVDEVNKVLNALGNLPFVQVFEVIPKIQAQADQQLNGKETKLRKTLPES
jgi:hypothetical protein